MAELPRQRFATGSAVTATFRQIGAVIGIAVLLAVLEDQVAGVVPASFSTAWWVMAVTGAVAAGCGVALGRVRARDIGTRALAQPPAVAT